MVNFGFKRRSKSGKKSRKSGKKGKMFRKIKTHFNFSKYTKQVLKQVHPNLKLGSSVNTQLNAFLNELGSYITREAMKLLNSSGTIKRSNFKGKSTLTTREIQQAVRIVFSGSELGKHAVSEGAKSFAKYQGNEKNKSMKRKSTKAGLVFDPSLARHLIQFVARPLRSNNSAGVYLAAVLEYITAELLELSGNVTRDHRNTIISPRHLLLAVKHDEELDNLFHKLNFTIVDGGVMPNIHSLLLSKHKYGKMAFGAGRGKGGKGLSKIKKSVHRRVLRDNIQGITKPAIVRLSRRAGIKRLNGLVYEELRGVLLTHLREVIGNVVMYTDYNRRKTITEEDVYHAINKYKQMYAFGKRKDRAIAEIKKYQKETNLLLPKGPFKRLVKEVMADYSHMITRLSENAVLLIQKECEHYIVDILHKANLITLHRHEITVKPKDIMMARKLSHFKN